MRKPTTYLLTVICFLLFTAGFSVKTAHAQNVEVDIAINGVQQPPIVGGGTTEMCANVTFTMTLTGVPQGTGPVTFTYNLRENNIGGTIIDGNVSTGPIAIGGAIHSAAPGTIAAGTYFIETLSITDANGDQVESAVLTAGYYNHTVVVFSEPIVSAATLQASVDEENYVDVGGTFEGGFELCLDPEEDYFYLDADLTISVDLLTNTFEQNGFYLSDYVAFEFYTYWAAKGVNNTATGWQGFMWDIIEGDEPMFYIGFDGAEFRLIDGLQHQIGSGANTLRVSGDYPPGTYTFTGTVTDENGCVSEPFEVVISFHSKPEVTYVALLASVDEENWEAVGGTLEEGFELCLDPVEDYYYLAAPTLHVIPVDLLPNTFEQNGFYLSGFVADNFDAYWASKGVNSTATGWQGIMWDIIEGVEPMFYIGFDGADFSLIDGLLYQAGSGANTLQVSGDYPPGTYTFTGTVTNENGCESAPFDVVITFHRKPSLLIEVWDAPESPMDSPYEFCLDASFGIYLEGFDGTGPYTLTYIIAGPGSFSETGTLSGDQGLVEINLDGNYVPGNYYFYITSLEGLYCSASPASLESYTFTVTVLPEPSLLVTVVDAAENVLEAPYAFCQDGYFGIALEGDEGTAPYTFTYTITGPYSESGSLSGTEGIVWIDLDRNYPPGIYTFTLENLEDSQCYSTLTYTLTIEVLRDPAIAFAFNGTLASSGSEFEYCYDVPVTVSLNYIISGVAPLTITWQYDGPSGVVSDTGTYNLNDNFFTGLTDPGTYTVTVTSIVDANGCSPAGYGEYIAYVVVNEEPTLELSFVDLEEPYQVCEDGGFCIQVEPLTGEAPWALEYEITGPGPFTVTGTLVGSVPASFCIDLEGLYPAGTYTVAVTRLEDNNGCEASGETLADYVLSIEVLARPEVTDATLSAAIDQGPWTIVNGTFDDGFELCLDPISYYSYLDADLTVSVDLLTSTFVQNGFYLSDFIAEDFYEYWADKGVISGAGDWQGIMWYIINGEEPMFYIGFDGTDFSLIDGLQYQAGSVANTLRVSGDYPPGTYTFTGSVTDENGCVSEDFDVVITFKHQPVLAACPSELFSLNKNGGPGLGVYDFERYNDWGDCGALVTFPDATLLFGTPTPTITYSIEGIGAITNTYTFPVGVTEVLVTASNDCGTDTCVFTVYVEDNEPPQLNSNDSCASLDEDAGNLCFSEALVFDPETLIDEVTLLYDDNCGVFSVTYARTEEVASSDCNWILDYLYRVEDQHGNAVTCTVTYSGGDTEPPVVVNADELDETFDCKGQLPAPNPDIFVLDDNCSDSFTVTWAPDIITNGDCLHNYTLMRVYTIKDECQNPTIFTQTFTVDDQIAPTLKVAGTLPGEDVGDLCFDDKPAAPAVVDIAALYQDNCSGTVTATLANTETDGDDCAWVVTYTYTVADVCGNTVTATVVYSGGDISAPEQDGDLPGGYAGILCYDAMPAAPAVSEIAGLYTDNCGVVTATLSNTVKTGNDCAWIVTYTYTVEDECMKSVTAQVIYWGGDTEAPTGTNTATLALVDACYAGALEAAPFSAAIAIQGYTDNCGNVSATYEDYLLTGSDCSWTITYTFTVEDDCENKLVSQTYTVSGRNTVPPSLEGDPYTGLQDVNACFDAALDEAPFDPVLALTGYEANCPGGTVTSVLTNTVKTGDDCAWVITYTYTVEDGCGLGLESQSYSNSGGNTTPPDVVFCPGDKGVSVDVGFCTYTVPDYSWDAVFYDYCGSQPNGYNITKIGPIGLTATYTLTGATTGTGTSLVSKTFNLGVTEVVWSAVDDCGNPASCTFTVTVRPGSLSGVVSYYKFDATDLPIQGVRVRLMDGATNVIATTYTDPAGKYSFGVPANLEDADRIEVSTNIPHGGLSSGDALAVSLKVANVPPTYWVPEKFLNHVGNVHTPLGTLNTTDAFFLFRRHVGLENSFAAGDWAFYSPADETIFTNTSANTAYRMYDMDFCELDISVRTFGDVRGTYNPVGPSPVKSLIPVQSDKVMNVVEGEVFELPVTVDHAISYNAVSFYLDYAIDKLEVLEVQSGMPGMTTMIGNGTIRIEWYDLASQSLAAGDAFIKLIARTTAEVTPGDLLFKLGSATEFVDATAQTIPDVEVSVSSLNTVNAITGMTDPSESGVSLEAFPNPFKDELTLNYQIDEPGSVRITLVSMTGATMAELINHQHASGRHAYQLNPGSMALEYGVYFVRMEVQGIDRMYHTHVKLIYMK